MNKNQLNNYAVIGDLVIIYTDKGESILIDFPDLAMVGEYKWYLNHGYAIAYDPSLKKQISMHRLLMNPLKGLQVDHINHQPWDNRRTNLRVGTVAQNQYNAKLRKDNTSGYKGVSFCKRTQKWVADLRVNGRKKRIGEYKNKEDAILENYLARMQYYGNYNSEPIPQNA